MLVFSYMISHTGRDALLNNISDSAESYIQWNLWFSVISIQPNIIFNRSFYSRICSIQWKLRPLYNFTFNGVFNWSESSVQFSPLFDKIVFSIRNSIRTHMPRSLLFNWIVYAMWTSIWRNLLFSRTVYLI